MSKQSTSSAEATKKELELLNYIYSLQIVSENQLGHAAIQMLLERGWIRKIWIGSYALTDAGKRARRDAPDS